MKKSIALLALAFGVSGAFAQDLTSKKGEPILPEAGDWAVSVDASPFLKYMGNFFGKTGVNNAPTWDNYGANNTIMVKKFTDAQNAYRATFRIGMRNQSWKAEIDAPQASTSSAVNFPSKTPVVEDKASHGSTFIGLGVGMEKRKGKTRLQGFYGADVFVWFSSSKDKFKYGNALTQPSSLTSPADPNVNAANSTNFSGAASNSVITSANAGTGTTTALSNVPNVIGWRKTLDKPGGQFGLGIRAFIGAEYFVLPKISIGGEFGWGIGLGLDMKSKTKYEVEGRDGTGLEIKSDIEVVKKRGMQFILDTDNNPAANTSTTSPYNLALSPSGVLRLNFHF